jgi:U3 small nucleolar RNA-associated protein 21
VAVEKTIYIYERTTIKSSFVDHQSEVLGMISIGKILVSYDSANVINMYQINGLKLLSSLKTIEASNITVVIHPATYINKILVAYENGTLELWNLMRRALIYTFDSHKKYLSEHQSKLSSISSLEQSPAIDVVAVGFLNGDILLVNLKQDSVLFAYKQDGGSVTSLSFRTDIGATKSPFLVSGSPDGRVHVWNLGQVKEIDIDDLDNDDTAGSTKKVMIRRLENTIAEAHMAEVSRVHFLYGEPVMISSGADNSLKIWIFDNADGSARLLRSRQGHQGPSNRIRFYGAITNASMREAHDGFSCEMLSSGSDSTFRYFNTALENQNREMSQQPVLKKFGLSRRNQRLSKMLDFDFTETRQRDWANLVTIHKDDAHAYLWKYKDRVITETVLRQPKPLNWITNQKNFSTAVAVSVCGNFAVIGTRGGAIYKYNIQSGLPRGKYPQTLNAESYDHGKYLKARIPGNVYHEITKILDEDDEDNINPVVKEMASQQSKSSRQKLFGHKSEVSGLFINITNTVMVSSGFDGKLLFWDFATHQLIECINHSYQLLFMRGYRDGSFVALACQDRVIRVYDIVTRKLCRRLVGNSREITDITFTPDGHRLISSSVDGSLRTWDIPTGRCLSWLMFDTAVFSIAISLSGEYLCVSQADRDGIRMYVDRSLYETIHFWKEPTEPTRIDESMVRVELDDDSQADNEDVKAALEKMGENGAGKEEMISSVYQESVDQRGDGSITLSSVPKAYWITLFHLEAIKTRNKGNETAAKPVQAPFFLPTISREDAMPSFPTPNEYAKLQSTLKDSGKTMARSETESGLQEKKKKRTRKEEIESLDESPDDFANLPSAWTEADDMENDASWGDDDDEPEQSSPQQNSPTKTSSRILKRKVELPR